MGKVIFTEMEREVHPQLALNNILASKYDDIDFRMSHDPDHCAAEDVSLGKCLKEFKTYTEKNESAADEILNKHYADTQTADYVIVGQDGYIRLEAKISKNKKRGTSYHIATKPNVQVAGYRRIEEFSSKAEAEKHAKIYAIQHLDKDVIIVNQKNERLGQVYLDTKHYPKKPSLTKKDGRAVLPAFQYKFTGTVYVG